MSTLANQPAVVSGGADEFEPSKSLIKRVMGLQAFWILGVLIVICLFFSVLAGDRFLSTGNFSLISQNVAVWAVLGVGMTFVIITSGIDLSVGSVLVFSSVVAAKVMEALGGVGPGVAAAGLVAAVVSGSPSASQALRAMFVPCSPNWFTHPAMTRSTSMGSIAARVSNSE